MFQASSLLVNSELTTGLSLPLKDLAMQSLTPAIIIMVVAIGVLLIDPLTDNDKSVGQRVSIFFTEAGAVAFSFALSIGTVAGLGIFTTRVVMLVTGFYNIVPMIVGLVVAVGLIVFRKKIATGIKTAWHKLHHHAHELTH